MPADSTKVANLLHALVDEAAEKYLSGQSVDQIKQALHDRIDQANLDAES